MERLEFAYHPEEISVGHIAFFTEVTNAARLKERLLASLQLQGPEGEQERAILNYAFIDAKAVSNVDSIARVHLTQLNEILYQQNIKGGQSYSHQGGSCSGHFGVRTAQNGFQVVEH